MAYRPDLTVFNSAGQPSLVVEVKARPKASVAWAVEMRNNLLAHGLVPQAKYFLLALPDQFYFWRDGGPEAFGAPPTGQIDPAGLLAPYYERAGLLPDKVSGQTFEFVIAAWLGDLLQQKELSADLRHAHPWLGELCDELNGGWVAHEAVA